MDQEMKQTLKEIEQRGLKALKEKWNCTDCEKEQPPPRTEEGLCRKCKSNALKQAQDSRMNSIEHWMKTFGVPVKLVGYSEQLDGMQWADQYALPEKDFIGVFPNEKFAVNRRGLCLTGGSGVGKSVCAALIIRKWLMTWALLPQIQVPRPENAWAFVGCAGLVMNLQDSFKDHSEQSSFSILKKIATVPRLVIDDLGTEKPTVYVRQALYYLINEREQWQRQTIITTNFSLDVIDSQYDSRISSRVSGMCDVRKLTGPDRRLKI